MGTSPCFVVHLHWRKGGSSSHKGESSLEPSPQGIKQTWSDDLQWLVGPTDPTKQKWKWHWNDILHSLKLTEQPWNWETFPILGIRIVFQSLQIPFGPYSKADHSVIWWTSTPGWKPGGLKLNVHQGWDIPSLKHQKLPNIFPPFKRKEEFFFLSLGERLLKSQFPPMALWLEASQTRKSGIIIFHVILHPKHPLDIFRSFVNIRPVRLNMCCKSHEPQVPWRDATMKRGHIETGYHHQPHLQGPVLRIGCSCWLAVFAVHTYSKDAFSCRHDGTKKTEERVTK